MFTAHPSISPDVTRLAPGFRALSISVTTSPVVNAGAGEAALRQACEDALAGEPTCAGAHLNAWSDVFRAFGAKPKHTPCSAEALRNRVLRDGAMATSRPDSLLYNALILHYAVPVGGENGDTCRGSPPLIIADGSEPFDTMKEGVARGEIPGFRRSGVVQRCRRHLSSLELAAGRENPSERIR